MINSKIEMKKLKFHTPDANGKSKCHTMHVGKCASGCPSLKVHGSQIIFVLRNTTIPDVPTKTTRKEILCIGHSSEENMVLLVEVSGKVPKFCVIYISEMFLPPEGQLQMELCKS